MPKTNWFTDELLAIPEQQDLLPPPVSTSLAAPVEAMMANIRSLLGDEAA
ncbi:MAG: hypothetical protein QOJ29_3437, partial [Thermoleophilaceae bacterium]|nr:hypothetical protein [Thermoleophilaceae bacterium]